MPPMGEKKRTKTISSQAAQNWARAARLACMYSVGTREAARFEETKQYWPTGLARCTSVCVSCATALRRVNVPARPLLVSVATYNANIDPSEGFLGCCGFQTLDELRQAHPNAPDDTKVGGLHAIVEIASSAPTYIDPTFGQFAGSTLCDLAGIDWQATMNQWFEIGTTGAMVRYSNHASPEKYAHLLERLPSDSGLEEDIYRLLVWARDAQFNLQRAFSNLGIEGLKAVTAVNQMIEGHRHGIFEQDL